MAKLESVQALRAVAALLVVVAHGALWAGSFGDLGLSTRGFELLGALGVLMFFAISGFIMLFISDGQFGRSGAAAAFLRRRILRIVPLYWLMTLLAAAMIVRGGEPLGLSHLVQSLLFLPYAGAGVPMRPVLGVGWTLNYEMAFYLLFAVSLLFRHGLLVLVAALVALLAVGQLLNPVASYDDPDSAVEAWTDPLLLPFLAGLGLALLRRHRPGWRVRGALGWVAVGAAALLLAQALLVAEGSYPVWWRLAVLLAAPLIAAPVVLAREGARVPGWLVLCGDASYSLYLIHPLLFGVVKRIGGEALAAVSAPAALLLYVAICLAAGLIVHLVLERPLAALFARRRRRPDPTPLSAANPPHVSTSSTSA